MSWLNIKTEFSFGAVFGPIDSIIEVLKEQMAVSAGICDIDGTFGFVQWDKKCKAADIKPIFGVSLPVVPDITVRDRRGPMCRMSFIAKTDHGLRQLYWLTEQAHNNFYYQPRISPVHVNQLDKEDVVVLSGPAPDLFRYMIKRPVLLQLSPDLPLAVRHYDLADVACIDNWYPRADDKKVYEPFAHDQGTKLERKTTPMHILTNWEWTEEMGASRKMALLQRDQIMAQCKAKLQKAPLVRYPRSRNNGELYDLKKICKKAAKDLNVNLKKEPYKSRLKYEIDLIKEKGYQDYFLVVADAINYAKQHMLVGPGRGSSGGSLVCFLMGITTIDPIKYDLIFERFIDINRSDLPDIDCDFPKDKRGMVIKHIKKKYGDENVTQIANILRLRGKSGLNRFAKSLGIPEHHLDAVKDVLIEREPGDAGFDECIKDTLTTTDAGRELMQLHPALEIVTRAEGHAQTSGTHAAGVLVGSEPINKYCGINTRDGGRVAMIDMREAEGLNLLKIDALGLRNLTILAEVCDRVNMPYRALYGLQDGDEKAYQLINDGRFAGIFQFEGQATRKLASKMMIESIEDLAALNAASRPGALMSGGANRYVNRKNESEDIEYLADHKLMKKITKPTAGVILYQEQVMQILREVGQLPWDQVIFLRKQMAKTLGQESFGKYRKAFLRGAKKNDLSKVEAGEVWKNLVTFGKYGFNKSHSVAYAILAYWCAYLKAHYPVEFAVASLNNPKSDRAALKLLRDMVENDGLEYVSFDEELSEAKWSTHDGVLYGGFETLKGIGTTTAKKAVQCRNDGTTIPKGIRNAMDRMDTPFKHLYPAQALFAPEYAKKTVTINTVKKPGDYVIIGQLMKRTLKDANDPQLIAQRDGYIHDGPTTYVTFVLEDDTEQINCMVGRHEFEELGMDVAHEGKLEETWYQVSGTLNEKYRTIFVHNLRRLEP